MMANMPQPFPPGMAPGHPMPHGHPMAGMQHPGMAHMGGQPGPGMMQGMHPVVSGPQVTQGPMVTGMPPGAGTPAPGGPMHNGSMAMAHLGPQQHMFQQPTNPQMNFAQMPMNAQQQQMLRQRMMHLQHQQQQQGMPMGMPGGPHFSQAQMAQLKAMNNMPSTFQQHMQMQAANQQAHTIQQQQQQQRMMAAHQQAALAAQNQHRAQAQQMQMSRSQEQTTQPPQPHPTPAPQSQPQPQPQPSAQPQPQPQPPQPKPQPQAQPPATQPPSQASQPVKVNEPEDEPQMKQQPPDIPNAMLMQQIPKQQDSSGQCILQLNMYKDSLAYPERPNDLDCWEEIIRRFFSPFGYIRQQLFSNRGGGDKSFQLQFASLARFYHAHFASGVKQIILQSFDHNQSKLPNGGVHIWSTNASLTYVFHNDIRVITNGSLKVSFNEMNKIEHLNMCTSGWQEYIPRSALTLPLSPDQKQSPKMSKNIKRAQGKLAPSSSIPSPVVGEWGVPNHVFQFLEIAEVMTAMAPLMEYYQTYPGLRPQDSLVNYNRETQQNLQNVGNPRLQNHMARAANGQVFPNQLNPGMNGPTQFASPALAHLGIPQVQGSPRIGGPVHTPSPAQNPTAGGVPMMHQMSAQGSNLSGSQGPSTNTSPNVSNKRRRTSTVKMEDDNGSQDAIGVSKAKPSPRIGGKRQKPAL